MIFTTHLVLALIVALLQSHVTGGQNSVGESILGETKIGEFCTRDADCVSSEERLSFCDRNVCACVFGYTGNRNGDKCLVIRDTLGTPCEESIQCKVQFSECLNDGRSSTCQCLKDQYINPNSTSCLEIRKEINLKCDHLLQCQAGLGEASKCEIYCQCVHPNGYYGRRCYMPSKLREPCNSVEQCFLGVNNLTVCTDNNPDGIRRCACRAERVITESGGRCFRKDIKVGHPCGDSVECEMGIPGGNVYCDPASSLCTCKVGFSADSTNSICASGASPNPGIPLFIFTIIVKFFAYH